MQTSFERELVVLAPEKEVRKALTKLHDFEILADASRIDFAKHIFINVSASRLPLISEAARIANDAKYLRALLIRADVDAKLLPQFLQRAELRLMRNTLVYDMNDWSTPLRVMNAWRMGSENDLIATAANFEDRLYVLTCAFERLEINFDEIKAFKKIKSKHRSDFEIDNSGSFLHWPDADIHIDIDAIRYEIDEKWRIKTDSVRLTHNKKFGQAIASVRKKHALRQSDISDLTDRQIRRIEAGEARPGIATLTLMASAHNASLKDYLDEVAMEMQTIQV